MTQERRVDDHLLSEEERGWAILRHVVELTWEAALQDDTKPSSALTELIIKQALNEGDL